MRSSSLELNAEKTRILDYGDGVEFLGQSLAPHGAGPRLEDGLRSFAEAERALQEAAGNVRRRVQRRLARSRSEQDE